MIDIEEHKKLGLMLKRMKILLYYECNNFRTKKEYHKSNELKAINLIQELKNILDDIMFHDYFDKKNFNELCEIYYEEEDVVEMIKNGK